MLVSLTGPSGIGKGYLKDYLLRVFPDWREISWYTTRQIRSRENYRNDRRIVTEAQFRRLYEQGNIILVQELYGYLYGMNCSDLEGGDKEILLTELQISNLPTALALIEDLLTIALVPADPNFLRQRLTNYRGTESLEEVELRLETARSEIDLIWQSTSLFARVFTVSEANEGDLPDLVADFIRHRLIQEA